jgi:integrase
MVRQYRTVLVEVPSVAARSSMPIRSGVFPRITSRDLRHIAASLVVSGGGNVLALARMLSHQSAGETLETYADPVRH